MILKNSENFITAPYVLSRKYVGNRLGAAVADCGKHLQFFDYGLQSFTWGMKTARACVPFSGDCSSLGPPNRGLEHSLNPVNCSRVLTLLFRNLRLPSLQAKTMPI
jgi:hypothetical protein